MADVTVNRTEVVEVAFGYGATASALIDALSDVPEKATINVEHYEGDPREPQRTTLTFKWAVESLTGNAETSNPSVVKRLNPIVKTWILDLLESLAPTPEGVEWYIYFHGDDDALDDNPEMVRVAEVGTATESSSAAYMQSDLPHGLALCAKIERVILEKFVEGYDDLEHETENLRYLLNEETTSA